MMIINRHKIPNNTVPVLKEQQQYRVNAAMSIQFNLRKRTRNYNLEGGMAHQLENLSNWTDEMLNAILYGREELKTISVDCKILCSCAKLDFSLPRPRNRKVDRLLLSKKDWNEQAETHIRELLFFLRKKDHINGIWL